MARSMSLSFYKEDNYICSMKTKETQQENLVKVPEKEFLSLVAQKLKDRNLFPEKIEKAKELLKGITVFKA